MQTAPAGFEEMWDEEVIRDLRTAVRIELGTNRFNKGQVCEASSIKDAARGIDGSPLIDKEDFWKPKYAFNGKEYTGMKWLVCDSGSAINETDTGDGYRCIDIDDEELPDNFALAWWSEDISDGSGIFSSPEWVKSEWFEDDGITRYGRVLNAVRLNTPLGYAAMKNVKIEYLNAAETWTEIWHGDLGSGELEKEISFSEVTAYGLRGTVYSTHEPEDHARFSEINGLYYYDVSEYIVNHNIAENREDYEGLAPVGTTSANSFDISLDNSSGIFSFNNDSSAISEFLVENNRVFPYFYKDGDDYLTDGLPMGVFYTDEWKENGGQVELNVGARDFSKFLQDDQGKYQKVWQGTKVDIPIREMLIIAGFHPDDIDIEIPLLRSYDFLYLDESSIWKLLGEIGLVERISFGFDRTGKFKVRKTERGRIVAYDDFVRDDTDEQELDGLAVKESEDDYEWEALTSFGATVTDGYLSTGTDHEDTGSIGFYANYSELDSQVTLKQKGTQDIELFFRHSWDDDENWIIVYFDFANETIRCKQDATTLVEFTDITYTDDSVLRARVDGSKCYMYVDGISVGEVSYTTPDEATGYVGISIKAQVGSTTLTKIEDFTLREDDPVVLDLSQSTNLEEASTKREIYNNEVVVKVSEINAENNGVKRLWGPDSPTILSYTRLKDAIDETDTTINIEREVRQTNGRLSDNGWPKYDGILFLPIYDSAGWATGGELIKYKERTDWKFVGCERGYAGTEPMSWDADSYIGEAREWDMEFSSRPAVDIKFPYVTAINGLINTLGEGVPQAFIPVFKSNGFGGKLIIGNTAKYLTWLEGSGQTLNDYDDVENDVELDFATSVAGVVPNGRESQEVRRVVEDPTAEDENAMLKFGPNKIEIESDWVQSERHARYLANSFIEEYSTPRLILEASTVIPPTIELGDRVRITEYVNMRIVNREYTIIDINMNYDGGLGVALTMRQV